MKKAIKKLRKTNRAIRDKKIEISQLMDSRFYIEFSNEEKRKEDINEAKQELKDLLDLKHAILETLQISINLELSDISYYQRTLLLTR